MKIKHLIILSATMSLLMNSVHASSAVASVNRFSLQLFQTSIQNKSTNVILAPYSVYNAFAVVYPGATGINQQQMQHVFNYTSNLRQLVQLTESIQHPGLYLKNSVLNQQENQQSLLQKKYAQTKLWFTHLFEPHNSLKIATSVWYDQQFALLPSYKKTISTIFKPQLFAVNFKQPIKASATMNHWASKQTDHLINNIIAPSDITPITKMAIMNAMAFHGIWQKQFSTFKTRQQWFHINKHKKIKTPMMHLDGDNFKYANLQDAQILEMPYLKHQYSMLIILPKPNINLQQLETNLTLKQLKHWRDRLRPEVINVAFPKMTLNYKEDLTTPLQSLGLKQIFIPNDNNFNLLSKQKPLFLNLVRQKTYLEVNEKGTKAASVSLLSFAVGGAVMSPPSFIADRPFMFLIVDNKSNVILFLGQINNPA